jgi:DNA-binding transcriptional regulator YiaG
MYHYRESGLPNVYLDGGYREIKTPYGPSIVIEDVEGLHFAIAQMLVNERPHLSGAEVRFIRRYLEKTQSEFAALLGVTEQSARRWESLNRVPKQADHAVRLLFLNTIRERATPFEDVVAHSQANDEAAPVNLHYRPRAKEWEPALAA